MVEEYTDDDPFLDLFPAFNNTNGFPAVSKNAAKAAAKVAAKAASTQVEPAKKPRILANGTDLILSQEQPGAIKNRYIRFSDTQVTDMSISKGQDSYTQVTIKLDVYGGFDTKLVDIPPHIPVEQHPRYVMGVFDAKK